MKKPLPSNFPDFFAPELDGPYANIEIGASSKPRKIELYQIIPDKPAKRTPKKVVQTKPKPRGPIPRDLTEYVNLIQLADKLYRRAENSKGSPRGVGHRPRASARKIGPFQQVTFHGEAERAYERALELLEQLFDYEPGVILPWLDRFVIFGRCSNLNPSPDPEGVPRVITIRSKYKRDLE